jgi:hypothetical protein
MASDARVLKNYITGQVGTFRPSATFTPLVRDAFDYYGGNCAFWNDVAACGNWYQLPGSVDVFVIDAANDKVTRSGNVRSPTAAVPYLYSYFGYDVAINDKWLVVGAYQDYVSRTNKILGGRVFVYHMGASKGSVVSSTWHELTHPQPASSDLCGRVVAVSGDVVAFACPYDESVSGLINHGTVIIQQYDSVKKTFVHVATKAHTDPASYHYLGLGVFSFYQQTMDMGKNGDIVIVGGPRITVDTFSSAGAVYIFVKEGNTYEQRQVLNREPTAISYCGDAVMFRGEHLLVGCFQRTTGSVSYSGGVDVYRYNAAKRTTSPFEYVQTLTTPVLMSSGQAGKILGMNDEGTRASLSSRGTSGLGTLEFFKLVNDKFIHESTMEGTTSAAQFGDAACYPVCNFEVPRLSFVTHALLLGR